MFKKIKEIGNKISLVLWIIWFIIIGTIKEWKMKLKKNLKE